MDRQRLIVCLFLSLGSVALADDTPSAPWGSATATSEAKVAEWASTSFAPATKPPAPAGDRYGAAPVNPMRSDTSPAVPFPAGNPLRKSDEPVIRVGATSDLTPPAAAIDAFAEPSASTPPAPGRIVVGATPVPREAAPQAALPQNDLERALPEQAPPPRTITIASEALAPLSPVERAPIDPIPQETPARVALAAPVEKPAYPEPAAFNEGYQAAVSPANEGVGQPGPDALEGPQEASLVVEKRGPREARIGQPCRFVVKVRNTGSGPAENVVLTDQTPAGTRLLRTQPVADQQNGRLVWRLGTLAAGDERTVQLELEPLREGPLGSVATVTMDASASASTTCTRPQLAIRVAAPQRVLLGEEQTISIELHNPGTGAATGVMLVEDVPQQLRHAAGPALEFEVGDLQPGETRRIDLHMTAAEAGHVVNAVAAVADGDLRAEKTVEFDVIAPSLAVSIDGPSRRYLERPASYTIGVNNPGTAPAKDVRLVTHLPRGMEFVSANNLGEYDATTHSVYWSLAELPEGERGEVEVVAMPTTAGEHTLRVQSEARDGLEAEQQHNVQVDGVASLAFEVRDLQDPIEVGAETVYEIRVLNEGTKAATGVRVRVEAPSGLRVVAADGDSANRIQAGRAEFAPLPRLEPGQKAAYRVRVVGAEPGDQRVTVLVESDEQTRPIRREESTRVFGDE